MKLGTFYKRRQDLEQVENKKDNCSKEIGSPDAGTDRDLHTPLVYVLILHWRGLTHTAKCLQSAQALKYKNLQITLIDNGSFGYETKELVKGAKNLQQLCLPENRGFAGGFNAGIDYSLEQGADFIWLLNNDTTVAPDSLDKLVQAACENTKAGALSALVSDMVQSPGANNTMMARGLGIVNYKKGKTVLKETADFEPRQCDWLAASNLLLKAQAVKEAGHFDERYFLYFEDTELCQRLRLAGWQCLLVPEASITHIGGASTEDGKLKYWRSYYYTRNRLLFFSTYTKGWTKMLALFFIWSHILKHCVTLPWRGEKGQNQLRAEILGARDFELKRWGKATCLDWCN